MDSSLQKTTRVKPFVIVVNLTLTRSLLKAFPEDLIIPGITARDVRLSLLVDQMFRDKFVSTSATSTPTKFSKTGINSLVHHPSNKRINLTDIMSVFRKGFCPCCGLPHLLAKCPVRKEHPPRVKCAHCRGEGHWNVDCGSLEKVASGSL
ncbi:hypothetical protein BDP27DRAFT_1420492 [Rhodocollybia butyracea]|uniref:CCHC-type domain-containing protein n=1 Tax=Rhodocollybia butyracea TaxID=206335 RepID=A0A9P5PUZ0_9AGAR|nr:hypothetical protein BDP27DRAFT_1420492 [Rhodocollybia butyracea]